jgi:hypothetical protein
MRSRQVPEVAPPIASDPAVAIVRAGHRLHEPWRSSERNRGCLPPLAHTAALDP